MTGPKSAFDAGLRTCGAQAPDGWTVQPFMDADYESTGGEAFGRKLRDELTVLAHEEREGDFSKRGGAVTLEHREVDAGY
jgi:hypothetical protein